MIDLKRVVLSDIKKIEIIDEEIPYDPNKVLVKIKYTGICGSDLHYYRNGGLGSFKSKMPMYLGHEAIGYVQEDFDNFKKGDLVYIDPLESCHKCLECYRRYPNLCKESKFLGANVKGTFVEYISVNPKQLFKLERLSPEKGIITEPLCVSAYAIEESLKQLFTKDLILHRANRIIPNILSIGLGPIGLLSLIYAKFKLEQYNRLGLSSDHVFGIDSLDYRNNFAKDNFGIEMHNDQRSYNIIVDSYGMDKIDLNEFNVESPSIFTILGIHERYDYISINPHSFRIRGAKIIFIRRTPFSLYNVIRILENVNIEKLVTHKFKLEDADKAFEIASNYEDNCMKVVLEP